MKKKASTSTHSSPSMTPHWGSAQHLFHFLEGGLLELSDLNEFLCQGGDIHHRNEKGETLLHVACRVMDSQALSVLLGAGSRARVIDKEKRTPLHWAVTWNQSILMEPLLKAGAKVDAQDKKGISPLMTLIQDKGWLGDSESKKSRLQSNLDKLLTHPSNLNLADEQGWTALHYAAFLGHLLPAIALLKNGASPALWDVSNRLPQDLIKKSHPKLFQDWMMMEEQYQSSQASTPSPTTLSQRL